VYTEPQTLSVAGPSNEEQSADVEPTDSAAVAASNQEESNNQEESSNMITITGMELERIVYDKRTYMTQWGLSFCLTVLNSVLDRSLV